MDENFNKLEESDTIIKRDSFEINNSQFHGITNERSDNEGIVFEEFVKLFHNSLDQVQTVVAHNLEFDINVLCAELYRYNFLDTIAKVLSKKQICTMKLTKNLVRAKFKNSEDIKDPSLKELYHFATGEELQNQHNSIYDVVNLYKVLKKLKLNIF
jgi:DNA polymerase III epsilon subunit-like protein